MWVFPPYVQSSGGYFIKFLIAGFSTQNIWTQLDLRFCENERSKRFKINEKQVNWIKIKEKIHTKLLKFVK